MSSAVCQGLQSYLDPWPKLTATGPYLPRSLSGARKVWLSDFNYEKNQQEKKKNEEELENNNSNNSSNKTNINEDRKNNNNSNFSDSESNKNKKNQSSSNGRDMGGWSFIQALANNSLGSKASAAAEEKEKLYIPPLTKRSPSKLSERSLEMCTENLGSETGSVITEEDIITNSSNCGRGKERPKSSLRQLTKANSREFPPPLTTISGSSKVQVRTHRDGGRLVMTAVRVPCSDSYFQAERGDGRLRLHLSTNYTKRFDPEFDSQATEETLEEAEEDVNCEEGEEEEVEEEEGEEAEAEIEKGGEVEEEKKEEESYRGEVDMGNYERGRRRRKSRCNEFSGLQNKLLLIQEPCWVATS